MYAHQVIDEIAVDGACQPAFDFKMREDLKRRIASSHKFHIGDVAVFEQFVNPLTGGYLFDSAHGRPPYESVWVDGYGVYDNGDSLKFGVVLFKAPPLPQAYGQEYMSFAFLKFSFAPRWLASGRFLLFTPGDPESVVIANNPSAKSPLKEDDDAFALGAMYSALVFLNCKGVATEDSYAPTRLNKKRRTLGRTELFSYKRLVVPATARKRGQASGHNCGPSPRAHFCRGHFKEYTPEKPLFGRKSGLFWCPPHVRGDKDKGIVHKDYVLKPA